MRYLSKQEGLKRAIKALSHWMEEDNIKYYIACRKRCSCYQCRNKREIEGLTIQEKRAKINEIEMLNE